MASFTKSWCFFTTILLGLAYVSCLAADGKPFGKSVLVVLDDLKTKQTHSIFFNSLTDRGYKLTYVPAEESLELKKYGEWNYDNIILFAPEAEELPVAEVLEFIDSGRNVLLAGSPSLADPTREIASECNVEFADEETFVIDHFNYDASDIGAHTLVVADNFVNDAPAIVSGISAPVLFRGIAQDIEENSELLFALLSGSTTAYADNPGSAVEDLHVAGQRTVLFSVLQARNNARVGFSGSLELFSDKLINAAVQKHGDAKKHEKSGNLQFVQQVTQWVFQERGILRATNVNHHRVGETETPATYTIKENVTFSVVIEEWDAVKGQFIPFKANDVQLEYRMLDPYVRAPLKSDNAGRFSTTFQLPDVYGIFTFKIDYTRKGYGFLSAISRVPVRPFRHNEYERFIGSAYPYYASALSMLGGVFAFSWFFLYHRDRKQQ